MVARALDTSHAADGVEGETVVLYNGGMKRGTDYWPILEASQLFSLRWLRKHVPRFGELPKQDQYRLFGASWMRAFSRPGPLVVIAVAVPATLGGYLFPDRLSIVYAVYWLFLLVIGWCLLAALSHEVRRDIRQKLS